MKYESLDINNYYHIFNQGNNGEDIFIEEMNYAHFLNLLKKHIIPVSKILSYCLLKNHFHLLVHIKEIDDQKMISRAFSNFFNAYAKSINKKYNRTGSLFRDRFRRIKVLDEEYLKKLIIYVNLNPIYHGFVSKLNEFKHSSYLSLISDDETFIEKEEVIHLFNDTENFIFYLNTQKIEFDDKLKELILE